MEEEEPVLWYWFLQPILHLNTPMLYFLWCIMFFASIWLFFKHKYTTFSRRGVKQLNPIAPIGDMLPIMLQKEHITSCFDRWYYDFPEERFIGTYQILTGIVFVRDLELIKKIAIKDFDHFVDHRAVVDEIKDPFFGRNLFSLRGQEWKDMRSTLSPAFTSSKMKMMVPFMVEVGNQMMNVLKTKIEESKDGYIDVDCRDMTTRYANDVIASCVFGLKIDSHTNIDNDFYKMGKTVSSFTFFQFMKTVAYSTIPLLMKLFKVTLFTETVRDFFKDLVLGTMKNREENNIIRPDMIQLLMDAKKGKLTHEQKSVDNDTSAGFASAEESAIGKNTVKRAWSDDDLIAQAVLFFVAGFETISIVMSFALHELALNPEVQDRLVHEIKDNEAKNDCKFDFNSVQNMPYMDMVVSEVLRLWPPTMALDRICTKDYNMGRPNKRAKKDFIIKKGTAVSLPIWCYHRDPQFFPSPTKFDPERFSEQNKHKIKPYTYMPFGLGPRNCFGSRFALCEVKVMLYQLLRNIELSPCEKTCVPSTLSSESFSMVLQGGHWLRFKLRQSSIEIQG